jgi:lipid A 3-O-deacylase
VVLKKASNLNVMMGFCLSLILASTSSWAEEEKVMRRYKDDKGVFSFTLENDFFVGEDSGYTNGAKMSWFSPEDNIPYWMDESSNLIPFFSNKGHRRYHVSIGQAMYAPENLEQTDLIKEDRPYAGWLYGALGLTSDTGYKLDNLEVTVGMVGPSSGAEGTQKFVHSAIGAKEPRGWDNQLNDELGVVVSYQRMWRSIYEFSPFGFAVDITPNLGASVGNIFTHAGAGATFRLGYDLPKDYGPPLIGPNLAGSDFFIPTKKASWYLFGGL